MKKIILYLIICLLILGSTGCNRLINHRAVSKYQKEAEKKEINSKVLDEAFVLNSELLKKSLLKEDEAFLLGNDMYYIEDDEYFYSQFFQTLLLVSGKGEILKRFTDVQLIGRAGIIKKNSKHYLGTYTDRGYLYGLYDFSKLDWEVEPTFKHIEQLSANYFSAVSEGERLGVINQDGNTVIAFDFLENEGYFRHMEDHLIFCNYEKMYILVYDLNGNQICEIPGYSAEPFGEYLMVYDTTSRAKLYDVKGNIVTDTNAQPEIEYYYDTYADKIIEVQENEYRVYDKDLKLLCKGAINNKESLYPQGNYFVIYSEVNGIYSEKYYDYEGNLLVTDQGAPYNRTNYRYLYYYNDELDQVQLLDTSDMKRFTLNHPLTESQSLIELGEKCLGISDYVDNVNRMQIYNKNGDLIFDNQVEWAFTVSDYILCTTQIDYNSIGARSHYVLLDHEGNKLYQSKSYEYIIPLNDSVLFVQRGCFLGIMDMKGNWLFKTITTEME